MSLRKRALSLQENNSGPSCSKAGSANPGLDFNQGLFFFSPKAFSQTIFFILFRVSNHQIVDKKNSTEFALLGFTSDFKFRTNPGFS